MPRSLLAFGLCLALISFKPALLAAAAQEVPRVIAALYDSTEEYNKSEDNNMIHNNAEMILNHLGFKVRYFDAQKGFPNASELKDTYAVLAWFRDDTLPNAELFCRQAAAWMESGKKMILIKNSSLFKDSQTLEPVEEDTLQTFYNALGVTLEGSETDNALWIETAEKDPRVNEFERTLDNELSYYEKITPVSSGTRSWLKLRRMDLENSESSVITTSAHGGFALEPYVLFLNLQDLKRQWRIEPFLYFSEALNAQDLPRFDTTTLLGKRIFYTHIDGDGFRNLTVFDQNLYSGESIQKEILEHFPIPFTVSFISAEIDPRYLGSERMEKEARSIAALPNVEIGSHTFTHPLNWKRQLTAFEIPGYATRNREILEENEFTMRDSRYPTAASIFVPESEYLEREIQGSTDYLNNLFLPEAKKVKILQWSGDCLPTAAAIGLSRKTGLQNINGGDTRFDPRFRSYTNVAPLIRQTSGQIQYYASSANENLYTNGWHGPFDGFSNVLETYRETENPSFFLAPQRRVKPINVYYHFYSGERQLSLKTLQHVYEEALSMDVIAVFTSEFLEQAEGFLSGRVSRQDDGAWIFDGYGRFGTVRWDTQNLYPDLERSQGIWGYRQTAGATYFHLSDAGHAVLYTQTTPPLEPYLGSASAIVLGLSINAREVHFTSRGFRDETFLLLHMKPGARYRVTVKALEEGTARSFDARADREGRLTLKTTLQGTADIRAQVSV